MSTAIPNVNHGPFFSPATLGYEHNTPLEALGEALGGRCPVVYILM